MEEPIKWLLIHATFRKPEVLIASCSVNQLATCPRNLQQSLIYHHWPKREKLIQLQPQCLSWDNHSSTWDMEAALDLKVVIQLLTWNERCRVSLPQPPPSAPQTLHSRNAWFYKAFCAVGLCGLHTVLQSGAALGIRACKALPEERPGFPLRISCGATALDEWPACWLPSLPPQHREQVAANLAFKHAGSHSTSNQALRDVSERTRETWERQEARTARPAGWLSLPNGYEAGLLLPSQWCMESVFLQARGKRLNVAVPQEPAHSTAHTDTVEKKSRRNNLHRPWLA